MNPDTYLGDGLYASWDGCQIRLYSSNGIRTTNEVLLDPDTLQRLEVYVAKLREAAKVAEGRSE